MQALSSIPVLAALAGVISACAPSLDLPPPPDLDSEARLEAFDNPDAVVVPQIMAEVDGFIAEIHDEVERSSFYEEILDVIVQVQDELYNENGEVDLGGGLTFETPNGGVNVDYICEGWEDPPPTKPDPANGSMDLNMRLAAGEIAPLVWGTLDDCKYPLQIGPLRFDALYRGVIALYFDEPLSPTANVYEQPVIFITKGSIVVDGNEFPIEELFRVSFFFDDEGNLLPGRFALEILVELADGTSFVYSFDTALGQQITDLTGTFSCSLEERVCESPSGTFSW